MLRRRAAAAGGCACLLSGAVLAVSAPGGAQGTTGTPSYFLATSAADGVTVQLEIDALLPVDEVVGLSSVTSEASLGIGRSDALAALPDPGDLVLTLPGTLSGLTGVPGLPAYPAASRAEHPAVPEDEVQLVPDGDVGAGRLQTRATEQEAAASAAVTGIVDAVGLLPSFSIGSVRTTATSRQLGPGSFRATATSTISDVTLLGELVRIDQITTEVTTELVAGRFTARAGKVDVSGATVAGMPVGITEEGVTGLGQPVALAPVVDQVVAPLRERDITIRTTPASEVVEDGRAAVTGGTVTIDVGIDVQGRPGTFSITMGRASSALEASGGPADVAGASDLPGGDVPEVPAAVGATLPLPNGPPAPGSDRGLSTSPGSERPGSGGAAAGSEQLVTIPAARTVADWQVTGLYRSLLLGGVLLAGATLLLRRSSGPRRERDLRPLWRW